MTYLFSKKRYIGRLKFVERKLDELPDMRLGTHKGVRTVRYISNGVRHEANENSTKWHKLYSYYEKRKELEEEYRTLCREFKAHFGEDYEKIKFDYDVLVDSQTPCTAQLWNELVDNECPVEKRDVYPFDNHVFRSRIEEQAAVVIKSLNLPYKYDCGILRTRYTDFAILLEEYGCFVFWEILGDMGNSSYINRTGDKFKEYSFSGYLVGRDVFFLGSTANFMPNADVMKMNLILMINTIAEMYVVKIR